MRGLQDFKVGAGDRRRNVGRPTSFTLCSHTDTDIQAALSPRQQASIIQLYLLNSSDVSNTSSDLWRWRNVGSLRKKKGEYNLVRTSKCKFTRTGQLNRHRRSYYHDILSEIMKDQFYLKKKKQTLFYNLKRWYRTVSIFVFIRQTQLKRSSKISIFRNSGQLFLYKFLWNTSI